MLKRRPTYKPHQSKISVEDVSDYTTPQGAAMANEEMRRLALSIEEVKKAVAPIAAEEKAVPVIPVKEAPKAEPPVVTTNNIENPITITSDDDSVVIRKTGDNYDLDVWDYEAFAENSFIPNPNGFDWLTGAYYKKSSPSLPYEVGFTVVHVGSSFYNCLITHTAGTFATDLAAGKWGLISEWFYPHNYSIGDLVWMDALIGSTSEYYLYRAKTNHASSAVNNPIDDETNWAYLILNDVYYLDEANRVLPLYQQTTSDNQNAQIDLRKINGDGWIPFFYLGSTGSSTGNASKIIDGTESIVDAGSSWIKKSNTGIQYEHPDTYGGGNRARPFQYFKPNRRGVYKVDCSVKLNIVPYTVEDMWHHWILVKGMLILDKRDSPSLTWSGDDFPLAFHNPIAERVLIGDTDIRHENNIWEILDRRTITQNSKLTHCAVIPDPPVDWSLGQVYIAGNIAAQMVIIDIDVGTGTVVWRETGLYYTCKVGHTSDLGNQPPNPAYWYLSGYRGGINPNVRLFEGFSHRSIDFELSGTSLVYASNLNECYTPWYKIYIWLIHEYIDPEDPGQDIIFNTNNYVLPITMKVHDIYNTIKTSYKGNDFSVTGNPNAYKLARLF